MDTPYAKLIEREVRQRVLLEQAAARDTEIMSLKAALQSQFELRRAAEQRVQELIEENMDIPRLQEKLKDLKLKIFAVTDSRAGAGMMARAEALKRDCFVNWHRIFLTELLAQSYKTRPRPNMRECQQEIEAIRAEGENVLVEHWNAMHTQLSIAAGRHLDLDAYQDGRPPPRTPGGDLERMIHANLEAAASPMSMASPRSWGLKGLPKAAEVALKRGQLGDEDVGFAEF